jgi:hypothetical protein
MTRQFFLACCAVALAVPAWAADAAGKWEAAIPSPRGEQKMTFDLKVDGESLSGTISNEFMGEAELSEGKVDGDKVSFKQKTKFGEREITFVYNGTLKGDEMELTRTLEGGMAGMGRRGGGEGGPGARGGEGRRGGQGGEGRQGRGRGGPLKFTAKRVK